MPSMIHARKVGYQVKFRIWSTITDSYTTKEMNEEQLREYTLTKAMEEAA